MAKRTFCISEDKLKEMYGLTGYADIDDFVSQLTDALKGQGWKCSTSDAHSGDMWTVEFDDGNIEDCPIDSLSGIYMENFNPDADARALKAGAGDLAGLEQIVSDIIDDSTHINADAKSATVKWANGEERSYEVENSGSADDAADGRHVPF